MVDIVKHYAAVVDLLDGSGNMDVEKVVVCSCGWMGVPHRSDMPEGPWLLIADLGKHMSARLGWSGHVLGSRSGLTRVLNGLRDDGWGIGDISSRAEYLMMGKFVSVRFPHLGTKPAEGPNCPRKGPGVGRPLADGAGRDRRTRGGGPARQGPTQGVMPAMPVE